MSSPVVETVRTIPLIVEQGNRIPMEYDDISGFPFDREADRDGHFRSQLDDIAKRHPEFAEHLGNFNLRTSPRRRSSGSTEDADTHRRFERPFGARFERFGFPFDREEFDPEQYAQQFYQPEQEQQQHFQQQPSYYQQHSSCQQQPSSPQQQQQPEYQQTQQQSQQQQSSPPVNTENPPSAPEGRNNIQQSNTIDLGQKQEPVNERNQRSMSAPPTEKGQRFTSSIKIPVNQPSESENMAQTQPQSDGKTTERIIPIHIEGRDEPVLPKNAPSAYPQPQPQTYSSSPQPERLFGQRPEHFTQFVNREPRPFDKWQYQQFEPMHHAFPEEPVRQQRYQQQNASPHFQEQQRPAPQQQQHVPPQHPKEEIPIPVQRDVPKQQVPQQQAEPPQPKPAPSQPQKPSTPIDQIQAIQKDVSELLAQVQQFAGKPKDKQYLYLDEMLTRNLLKLDNIDTQGQDTIRSARKEAIKCIERAIGVLEAKAAANVAPPKVEETMEVEQKSTENPGEDIKQNEAQLMETEPTTTSNDGAQQSMEIVPEIAALVDKKEENKVETEQNEPTAENKIEAKAEQVESKTEPLPVEELKIETCEGQESNLPVSEAVKKFEGGEDKKESAETKGAESKPEDKTSQEGEGTKAQEKKEKKKGKKKAEKKEK